MTYAHIEVEPLAGALGAEIHGVDLSTELSEETFAEVHRAFLEHLVICFRDQHLSRDQHKAFGRHFGPLMIHPYVAAIDGHPEVIEVIKDVDDTAAFGGVHFHSDMAFMAEPSSGSILYAHEVPPHGGDTVFANMYLAHETLSPGMQRMLESLNSVNTAKNFYGTAKTVPRNHSMTFINPAQAESSVVHPVVRTHPETGRRSLYVGPSDTQCFEGMSEAESRPILEYLYAHATRPELTFRLRYAVGTVVVWDNRCTQHYAINDYDGHRRVMDRVTIQGDRPV